MDIPDTMARIEEKMDRIEKNSVYSRTWKNQFMTLNYKLQLK